jgi:hypothetical protein
MPTISSSGESQLHLSARSPENLDSNWPAGKLFSAGGFRIEVLNSVLHQKADYAESAAGKRPMDGWVSAGGGLRIATSALKSEGVAVPEPSHRLAPGIAN